MRVLVFGSSIAQGFWDPEGGWVQRLRKQHDMLQVEDMSRNEPLFFNLGVSGDSSAKLCKRFRAETVARTWPGDKMVFVIAIGVNDACIEAGKPWATPEEYRQNLNKLIDMAQEFSPKILFVELTPCVQEKTDPVARGDYVYRNEDLNRLNEVLREVCAERNIDLAPIAEAFAGNEKDLLPDGLHPNSEGHQLIADLVSPELDKLL